MTRQITKGMVLAAGFGTRLKPLTDEVPKPLIQVGDRSVIEYNLALLSKSWVGDIIINLHHLGDYIKKHVGDGSKYDLHITYSDEEEILGTGGGIKKVESFFKGEPFIAINGDVITDANLVGAMAHHIENEADATLVLRPLGEGETYTPIREENGMVTEFGGGDMMYTGIQIVDPSVLKLIRPGVFANMVQDAYIPLIKQGGKIAAYIHDGFWTEIGTPAALDTARRLFQEEKVDFWYL